MPFVSSAVSVAISNLQNAGKIGSNDNAEFLELLENSSAVSDKAQSGKSLVDLLYADSGAETPLPGISYQSGRAVDNDNSDKDRNNYKNGNDEDSSSEISPHASPVKELKIESGKKKDVNQQAADNGGVFIRSKNSALSKEENSKAVFVKSSSASSKKSEDSPDDSSNDVDSLSRKIRAKINDLSEMLALLASSLGFGSSISITTVKITQTTISADGKYLPDNVPGDSLDSSLYNSQMLDLSGRFEQLLAAVSSSQHLPENAKNALASGFSAFGDLLNSLSAGGISLAQCLSCEDKINFAISSFTEISAAGFSAADKIDNPALAENLQQLSGWLGDLQSIISDSSFEARQIQKLPDSLSGAVIENADGKILSSDYKNSLFASADNSSLLPNNATQNSAAAFAPQADKNSALSSALPVIQAFTANQASALSVDLGAGGGDLAQGGGGGGQQSGYGQFASVTSASSSLSSSAKISGGASAEFAKLLDASNRPSLAEQVSFNIKTAVKDGTTTINIKLDPAELGKLHIVLDLNSDGLASNLVVTADNKTTLNLLQRDAAGLERALADAGIKMESGGMSFNLQNGNQQQEARQQFSGQKIPEYLSPIPEENEIAPLAVLSRSYVVNLNDGLDIKI